MSSRAGRGLNAALALALLVAVPAAAKPTKVRYLALGDSFTAGTGATPAQSYPAKLVDRWNKAGVTVELKNVAVNGYTTDDLISRELPDLKTFKPQLVSIAIGANDIVQGRDLDSYKAQLKRIFKAVLDAGVKPSHIYCIPQPDWTQSEIAKAFGNPYDLHASVERFNYALEEEAKANGARYVNLWPMMVLQMADGLRAADGLHPSAEAYDAWAAELFKALPPDTFVQGK